MARERSVRPVLIPPVNSQGRTEFSGAATCRFPEWNKAGGFATDFASKTLLRDGNQPFSIDPDWHAWHAHVFTYSDYIIYIMGEISNACQDGVVHEDPQEERRDVGCPGRLKPDEDGLGMLKDVLDQLGSLTLEEKRAVEEAARAAVAREPEAHGAGAPESCPRCGCPGVHVNPAQNC